MFQLGLETYKKFYPKSNNLFRKIKILYIKKYQII